MKVVLRWTRNIALVLLALLVLATIIVSRLWQDRPAVADFGWPTATPARDTNAAVTVTWLGISTLLFDDGDTQILIDGTFTRIRPTDIAPLQTISSDVAAINHALSKYRIDRLAAIVPAHSHFDHAMDIGYIANRTSAVILGSQSTANIAKGAEVPVDQYQTLADGETRQFGNFTITLLASRHAPIGTDGEAWFPGSIDSPLRQPAHVSAWREGVTWSILIGHPRGTTLINGSAGYIPGKLQGVTADVAILGIAGLAGLGREYVDDYWQETIVTTGARRLIAVHFDDFTAPFGEIVLFPKLADDIIKTAGWLDKLIAAQESDVSIELPPFGQPIELY
ncbi:MAG: MBL fold metallo-hydrolase [Gammaproteobacteria bacterium]|nr:MAG: MBL fold metallo-hydrolase [Gammaproteobacteria bacterium]